MSNTNKRILSAIILASIVALCMYMGATWTLALIFIVGALVVDEIYLNFLKRTRSELGYLSSMSIYAISFFYLSFINSVTSFFNVAVYIAIALNIVLTIFLFKYIGSPERKFIKFLNKNTNWVGLYVLVLFLCLAYPIIFLDDWLKWIFFILLINFSADTFAWFFGRKYGKRKLMPTISPKKTVAGAVGGILSSIIIGLIYWFSFIGTPSISIFLALGLIAVFSVIGDLVQSKLKRLFKIKDSSALIPGHGGVFDRLDSLLFVMPFYIILLIPQG